ncbi:pVII [Equine adenovirus 2]|uniref:PVII n=1 Tax=Equine adenovirus B serotype 2 TaxID=67603 RepID=A0A0K1DCH3_ADEE2|nr:pVII [Equine adenovirus 2]AKT26028.1 pVII [Equine adenovirus 2]
MAILVSPSNNSGWGLGLRSMYGGARKRSAEHPVRVRGHYRAAWGSKKGTRTRGTQTAPRPVIKTEEDDDVDAEQAAANAVADVVAAYEAAVANGEITTRRRRRRRTTRRLPDATSTFLSRAIDRIRRRRRPKRRRRATQ